MQNLKFQLATFAAKIATIHDKRKELENQIALIYKGRAKLV